MSMTTGTTLGPYEIVEQIGAGGPASAHSVNLSLELWRGLAEAKLESRP